MFKIRNILLLLLALLLYGNIYSADVSITDARISNYVPVYPGSRIDLSIDCLITNEVADVRFEFHINDPAGKQDVFKHTENIVKGTPGPCGSSIKNILVDKFFTYYGEYTFVPKVVAGGQTVTGNPVSFTIEPKTQDVIKLIAPADGETIKTDIPEFQWENIVEGGKGVKYYRITVCSDSSFIQSKIKWQGLVDGAKTVVQYDNGLRTTDPVVKLEPDNVYYWRVEALDTAQKRIKEPSTVRSFKIDTPGSIVHDLALQNVDVTVLKDRIIARVVVINKGNQDEKDYTVELIADKTPVAEESPVDTLARGNARIVVLRGKNIVEADKTPVAEESPADTLAGDNAGTMVLRGKDTVVLGKEVVLKVRVIVPEDRDLRNNLYTEKVRIPKVDRTYVMLDTPYRIAFVAKHLAAPAVYRYVQEHLTAPAVYRFSVIPEGSRGKITKLLKEWKFSDRQGAEITADLDKVDWELPGKHSISIKWPGSNFDDSGNPIINTFNWFNRYSLNPAECNLKLSLTFVGQDEKLNPLIVRKEIDVILDIEKTSEMIKVRETFERFKNERSNLPTIISGSNIERIVDDEIGKIEEMVADYRKNSENYSQEQKEEKIAGMDKELKLLESHLELYREFIMLEEERWELNKKLNDELRKYIHRH